MAKGNTGGKKTSHYNIKKRCQWLGCKKRAKYNIDGRSLCKKHWRLL